MRQFLNLCLSKASCFQYKLKDFLAPKASLYIEEVLIIYINIKSIRHFFKIKFETNVCNVTHIFNLKICEQIKETGKKYFVFTFFCVPIKKANNKKNDFQLVA